MTEGFHLKLSRERAECLINCLISTLKDQSCESVTLTEIHDCDGHCLSVAGSNPVIKMVLEKRIKKPMPKPNTTPVM